MSFNMGGGLSGAASGASMGAMFGPIGMGIGAIGGGLLGGFGGKKGGGAPPPPMALNPSFGMLNQLFGTKMIQHGHGDDAGTYSMVRNKKNPGVFGGLQDQISNYINNPIGLFGGERGMTQGLLEGNGLQDAYNQTSGGLDQLLASNGGYQSGFRTSAQPIYQEANRNFQANMLPQIAEMIGPQVGLRSQSFVDAASRAGSDLMGQAALQDVNLQEAAAGRIPMAAQLLQARGALPLAFGNDTLSFGNSLRNMLENDRTRGLQIFQQLNGMAGPGSQGFLQQGFNPQGSGAANQMSGIGSMLGGLGGMMGGGGGGGGQQPGGGLASLMSMFGGGGGGF